MNQLSGKQAQWFACVTVCETVQMGIDEHTSRNFSHEDRV
jgi:hypothetical protein